jgi:hypothetical protein
MLDSSISYNNGCVWVAVIRRCCDCASYDDIRAIAHDLCWQFLQQMEVFLSIVGCGAGGRELRFRRLEPLTWIFGKKGRHEAYGYVCFGDGGDPSWRGGSMQNGGAMLRWLFTQLGLLGGH